MCEFCLNIKSKGDAVHPDFAGFFSADAIEAAIRQVNTPRRPAPLVDDDSLASDDTDGT
jgi:hypothetical protein